MDRNAAGNLRTSGSGNPDRDDHAATPGEDGTHSGSSGGSLSEGRTSESDLDSEQGDGEEVDSGEELLASPTDPAVASIVDGKNPPPIPPRPLLSKLVANPEKAGVDQGRVTPLGRSRQPSLHNDLLRSQFLDSLDVGAEFEDPPFWRSLEKLADELEGALITSRSAALLKGAAQSRLYDVRMEYANQARPYFFQMLPLKIAVCISFGYHHFFPLTFPSFLFS